VRRGSAEFIDRSAPEPYAGSVKDLTVDVAGVSLPERSVQTLRVRGIAPGRAPFDLRAALPGATGSLTFKLTGLPLAQFTPYASRAADLRIPKGDLSLDAKARFANGGAAGNVDSQVVVHQLAIQGGPNAISVAGMPIDLALALLRDPRGDIALPIPLQYGKRGASAGTARSCSARCARRSPAPSPRRSRRSARSCQRAARARSPSRRSFARPGLRHRQVTPPAGSPRSRRCSRSGPRSGSRSWAAPGPRIGSRSPSRS